MNDNMAKAKNIEAKIPNFSRIILVDLKQI
jgi:hypothetical protein